MSLVVATNMERQPRKPVAVALLLVLLLLQLTVVSAVQPNLQPPQHDPIAAVRGLIQRRLGDEYVDQVCAYCMLPFVFYMTSA
jgi:hypothetical protein